MAMPPQLARANRRHSRHSEPRPTVELMPAICITGLLRTGFGAHRAIFVCNRCRCGAIRLFARHGTYACCHCHRALYASQKHNQTGRKRLQASKLACNSAACQTSTNRSRPSPNGRAAGISTHPQRNPKPRSQNQRKTVQEALSPRVFAYHIG
jgi:hypothetical protein